VTVFALPLVIVVGREGGEGGVLAGVIEHADGLAAILREHGALSGSSNFALSDALIAAEGFRCPLFPIERVSDVGSMLVTLLSDCRVTDIRMLDGVHADRGESGTTLLFKPETIADAAKFRVH
jgi:hypothetical protein